MKCSVVDECALNVATETSVLQHRLNIVFSPIRSPTAVGYRQACKEYGFFYLENHGIPEEVMEQVFQASKAFFSLGQDDKMTVKADKNNRGYTPMHEEVLDPENQTRGDTKVRV